MVMIAARLVENTAIEDGVRLKAQEVDFSPTAEPEDLDDKVLEKRSTPESA
jgi:hypothetical protein